MTGRASHVLKDAAAFPVVGLRHLSAAVGDGHLIVYLQRPNIGPTLDVQQRFAEDVVRKIS